MAMSHFLKVGGVCMLVVGLLFAGWPAQAEATPLDDYVAAADPSYGWTSVWWEYDSQRGLWVYVLDLTSQTWRTPEEVNRTEWHHDVIVAVPDAPATNKAVLIIEGGDNDGDPPGSIQEIEEDDFQRLLLDGAAGLNTTVVYLGQIPNQRLIFPDDPDPRYVENGRKEDELIAYSWWKAINTLDPNWAAQLPMTKAVVRAMDAVEELTASPPAGGSITISDFIVGGGSKRGWATWLTAAVDPRVSAIAPLVIDVLNVEESFDHHWNSLGLWSEAVVDYVDIGIMDLMGDSRLTALFSYIDPYVYRDRLTMPKYIVNGTNDEFFCPESSQFYWDDLIGEKHLRYVPNMGHGSGGLALLQAFADLSAYLQATLAGTTLPQFSWTLEPDGSIRVETVDSPTAVKLWQATTPTTRDFRNTFGPAPVWSSSNLTDQGGGVYIGQVPEPESGFTGFLVELSYPGSLKFTTQVRVLPEPIKLKIDYVNGIWGTVEVASVPYSPTRYYYDPNTIVTLTAVPNPDREFNHWVLHDPAHPDDPDYDVIDPNNPITLPMDVDRRVTAVFACGQGASLAMMMMIVTFFGLKLVRHRP